MDIAVTQSSTNIETRGDKTHVAVRLDADLKVSPDYARNMVMRLLKRQLGPLMRAEEPELIVGERWRWRVPIVLSLPDYGDVGIVDWIEMDAQTTEIELPPGRVEQIAHRAQALASTAPPSVVPPELKVRVPAAVARRCVTSWVISNVGNMLVSGDPRLVGGERALWRVPVMVTSGGQAMEIGVIEIEADSGEMVVESGIVESLQEKARAAGGSPQTATE